MIDQCVVKTHVPTYCLSHKVIKEVSTMPRALIKIILCKVQTRKGLRNSLEKCLDADQFIVS